MKIALVNFWPIDKNPQKNLDAKKILIEKILKIDPKISTVIFPELSFTGYLLEKNNKNFAENLDGFCISGAKNLAKNFGVNLIGGFIEKNEKNLPFNSAFAISKTGKILGIYRKNHLFSQSPEAKFFATGGGKTVIFELENFRCGISICFDVRFPRLFEFYKKSGAEIIFGIFNWVTGPRKILTFNFLNAARAHENQFFVAAVDRIGRDKNCKYCGCGGVFDPRGKKISRKIENFYFAEIQKNKIAEIEKNLPLAPGFLKKYF